jgi:integrase
VDRTAVALHVEVATMAKRQFGSVRQLSSGRFQARYRHPVTNQRISAPSTFPNKGAAQLWLAGAQTDLARGERTDQYLPTVTLEEYSVSWLENRVLRPRTVELYQGLLDRHIVPKLGGIQIGRLSPSKVREWHAGLSKATKPGPVTVAKCYRLLRTICETAYTDELISRNPCNLKGASVERSPERPVMSIEQLNSVVDAMEDRYRAMVVLGSWCSMRIGEILALTRADIDLQAGTVSVDKSAWELGNRQRMVGPPKTAAGVRAMFIPPHVRDLIADHLDTFTGSDEADLVFVGINGQPVRRATVYTAWHRALEKADLGKGAPEFRFHDLRHTGATLAAGAGASTRELMARLGHASSAASLRYQHATSSRDESIAERLSELAIANGDGRQAT